MPRFVVLCRNDFPIGIYTDQTKAKEAEVKAAIKMKQQGRDTPMAMNFHRHEFEIDMEPKC